MFTVAGSATEVENDASGTPSERFTLQKLPRRPALTVTVPTAGAE